MTLHIPTAAVFIALALCAAAQASSPQDNGPGPQGGPGPRPPEDGRHSPPGPRQQLFISPAGQPFRAPADAPYPVSEWLSQADSNHDGALARDEFVADAARFFTVLDTDKDGVIDGFEVSAYERNVAPEILTSANLGHPGGQGGRGGPPGGGGEGPPRKRGGMTGAALQGAAPYSLLAEPQPVMGADADFNRRISRDEALKAAKARFNLLDKDQDGLLGTTELPSTPVQMRRR